MPDSWIESTGEDLKEKISAAMSHDSSSQSASDTLLGEVEGKVEGKVGVLAYIDTHCSSMPHKCHYSKYLVLI